jgi:hypothetical protein
MSVSILSNLHFGQEFMVLHTGTIVEPACQLVMSISMYSPMILIYGHHFLVRSSNE